MDTPTRARSWKRRTQPRVGLEAAEPVLYSTLLALLWELRQSSLSTPSDYHPPLPDKPSIAVLPFTNMTEDPKQEYLADGIAEGVITGLIKLPSVFVISRVSSFTYKGKPVKVREVS